MFDDTQNFDEIQISVPINKVLLEDSHTHHLHVICGCLHTARQDCIVAKETT